MPDDNRIGYACWYRHDGKARRGHLRMWGMSFDERLGQPVAVVEDDETQIPVEVDVDGVCFATAPPWPLNS